MFEKLGIVADIHGNALALEAALLSAQQHTTPPAFVLGTREMIPSVKGTL